MGVGGPSCVSHVGQCGTEVLLAASYSSGEGRLATVLYTVCILRYRAGALGLGQLRVTRYPSNKYTLSSQYPRGRIYKNRRPVESDSGWLLICYHLQIL